MLLTGIEDDPGPEAIAEPGRQVAQAAEVLAANRLGCLDLDADYGAGRVLQHHVNLYLIAVTEVEELHGVPVESVVVGDAPIDTRLEALVQAAREAMRNAAKFAGAERVDLYAEIAQARVEVFVRDRGVGFDPQAIPSCTVGENLYSNHGRGIFLINQLMDEVQFHKNGTEIHMVKR